MPVYKRKYRSEKMVWYFQFALPGSTRQNQNLVTESGFATKQQATDAEAVRHAEELVRQAATGGVAAPMPTTAWPAEMAPPAPAPPSPPGARAW